MGPLAKRCSRPNQQNTWSKERSILSRLGTSSLLQSQQTRTAVMYNKLRSDTKVGGSRNFRHAVWLSAVPITSVLRQIEVWASILCFDGRGLDKGNTQQQGVVHMEATQKLMQSLSHAEQTGFTCYAEVQNARGGETPAIRSQARAICSKSYKPSIRLSSSFLKSNRSAPS